MTPMFTEEKAGYKMTPSLKADQQDRILTIPLLAQGLMMVYYLISIILSASNQELNYYGKQSGTDRSACIRSGS